TLMYVLSGGARVLIDYAAILAREGDVVYVPRWALHQTQNTGDSELRILAVTDFGLATRAFVGAYQHREKEQDERAVRDERSTQVPLV
ncbi:MAG: cupin domain-containing protein, partial [Gammaproteobacteria bacterium]